jgi:hypothetical protein
MKLNSVLLKRALRRKRVTIVVKNLTKWLLSRKALEDLAGNKDHKLIAAVHVFQDYRRLRDVFHVSGIVMWTWNESLMGTELL